MQRAETSHAGGPAAGMSDACREEIKLHGTGFQITSKTQNQFLGKQVNLLNSQVFPNYCSSGLAQMGDHLISFWMPTKECFH